MFEMWQKTNSSTNTLIDAMFNGLDISERNYGSRKAAIGKYVVCMYMFSLHERIERVLVLLIFKIKRKFFVELFILFRRGSF